jgi:hypothetical protein
MHLAAVLLVYAFSLHHALYLAEATGASSKTLEEVQQVAKQQAAAVGAPDFQGEAPDAL